MGKPYSLQYLLQCLIRSSSPLLIQRQMMTETVIVRQIALILICTEFSRLLRKRLQQFIHIKSMP
ncbi:hypothetical protein D3C86_2077720 [compost metagenome]